MNKCNDTTDTNRKIIQARLKEYAAMGLAVIPCLGKRPCIKNWQNRGVPTLHEIDSWIAQWPDMNIGLVLGSASSIVGIDLDGQEAKKRLDELAGKDLPPTWTFKTPGGIRFLYKLPEGVKAKKYVETLEGEHSELALLGEGQQTIMPPSVNENGVHYRWYKGKNPKDCELAPAPQWMLDLMTAGGKVKANEGTKRPAKKPVERQEVADDEVAEVFERLKRRCNKFQNFFRNQSEVGLSEEDWFRSISLLVKAGHPEAAKIFSQMSQKHDERSVERLNALIDQVGEGTGPMTRCTTLGCDEEQIEACFPAVNENDEGEVTNSPGSFVRDMKTLLPPTDAIYLPYVNALADVKDYDIDESGNLCSYDGKDNPFRIANFVARPILEVIRDDGIVEDRSFRIVGVLKGGAPLSPVDVSASEFAGMNWVLKNWGITPSISAGFGNKDLCRDAIQNMAKDVVQQRIYTHLGWRKIDNNNWVYLHAGGCIGASNVNVEIDKQLERYRLPDRISDLKKAVKASFDLLNLAPKSVTIPLLALVYIAPLVEFFRQAGLEPTFLIWLYGGTGTRKTSMALVFLGHSGDFATKNPPASFKDTANALERRAFATKDTLLLVDDYHPEASRYESQKMENTAQRLLRMYGDRVGRGRLKSTIEFQREFPPRGMAIVTGEDLPGGQSSVARFLGLELLQDEVDLNQLTNAQNNAHLFSEAMAGYIQWLMPQLDELPQLLAERFREKRTMFQENAAHGRLGDTAAWIFVAFEMALEFFTEFEACSEEQAKELLEEADTILAEAVQKQGRLVNREKPAEIFAKVLSELLATNKARVDPVKPTSSEDYAISGEKIGWYDETFFYLLPEASYNAVSRFLSTRGETFPVKERTLWKQLDEAKLLMTEVGQDGRVQRLPKKTIPGRKGQKSQRPRLLHVHRAALQAE